MNHIVLMGRLTRDPELRHTPNGTPVASFTLAVDRGFAPKDGGERQTDFIDIVAWRGTGEVVSKYFTKGQMAAVSGRLQIRDWLDKDNNKRRNAEVVADNVYFTESKKSRESNSQYSAQRQDYPPQRQDYAPQRQEFQKPEYNNNAGYSSPVSGSDFSELDMDEADFPF